MPACRSSTHRGIPALVVACILTFTTVSSVRGQHAATPVPGDVIPGEECILPARPITFLGILVSTPLPEEPYVPPTGVPDGTPLDDQTAHDIGVVIRQFIACSNSGDVLRALSLFDDAYLRRVVDPTGELKPDTADEIAWSFATPTPLDDEHLVVFVGIREMIELPDGRVAVVLETDGGIPDEEGTDVDLFIFERVDDEWLIVDAVSDIDEVEADNSEG